MERVPPNPDRDAFMRTIRSRHPGFREAIAADAAATAAGRGERSEFRSAADAAAQIMRLAWVSDAFLAQAAYRLKARLQALGVPVLPRLAHRLSMAWAQVSIGDPVVVSPGVYLLHGQVVIDGLTEIGTGTFIAPWVTIGLRPGNVKGPSIGRKVQIGTGAKILGDVTVGDGARIAANSVVLHDVAPRAVVGGAPARPLGPEGP